MSSKVRIVPIDSNVRNYTSVLIGRQVSRASVIGALSITILAPILAPLAVSSISGVSSLAVAVTPSLYAFMVIFVILVLALVLVVSQFLYRILYRGSRRILTFLKRVSQVSVPMALFPLFVPFIIVLHARSDPLIIIYAGALLVSIAVGFWFAQWTKSYVTDWQQAYRDSPVNYQYFSPGGGSTFSFMIKEMFGTPPGWLVDKKKILAIIALMSVALILEGLAFSFILYEFQSVSNAAKLDLPRLAELTDRSEDSRSDFITSSIAVLVAPLLSFPLLALSSRVRRAARRAAVHSVDEVRAKDPRAPLLFLRSFHDDQVALIHRRSRNIFQRVLCSGSLFPNVDELLTERYWHIGPVIAVGKPGEALPPLGAARAYLAGQPWQTVVAGLVRQARTVVIALDYTEGVMWELRQVRDSGSLAKSLILVPPNRYGDSNLILHALAVLGIRGETAVNSAGSALAILPGPNGQLMVCCSNHADSYAYDFILRMGLHAILENRTGLLEIASTPGTVRQASPQTAAHPAPLVKNAQKKGQLATSVGCVVAVLAALAVTFTYARLTPASARPEPSILPTRTAPATASSLPTQTQSTPDPAAELQQEADSDSTLAASVVGSWVPQISSKRDGLVVDGVTYNDNLVWADFERSRAEHPDAILVRSGDFSSFRNSGYWVTLIAEPYSTAGAANVWCDNEGYSVNDCFAKRLSHTAGPDGNTVLRN